VPIGAGGNYAANSRGGANTAALTINEMPRHNHIATSNFVGSPGTSSTADLDHNHNETWAGPSGGTNTAARLNSNGPPPVTGGMNQNRFHNHTFTAQGTVTTNLSLEGSGEAFSILPPYLGIYFVIKT
jgi:microcystin-dependent protein